uniref:EH domain-containing protein n=1 Tax=Anopheles minimus TaxID=112268 RepID=A0A182W6X6_9DIPT
MDELSEAELRYYNDLFKICSETDGAGKIPALKATSLFRSANLSNETINKITALAGIPQTALHLSRQQFYGCLKLIAAFQAAVPLREEILTTSVNLPLPQFSWIDPVTGPSGASDSSTISSSGSTAAATSGGGTQSGSLERNGYTEVNNRSTVKVSGTEGSTTQDSSASTGGEMTNSDQPSTDSEVDHNDDPVNMIRGERERHTVGMLKGGGIVMIGNSHPLVGGGGGGGHGGGHGGGGGSPEAWSTASDSPTPTNSVAERPWANQNLWQGLVCEEQRQLLGTEEESSDRHSSDEDELIDEEIDLEYFYQISQTQKDYYLKQFRTIQPDVHGLVTGPVARVFFEKSRIPIDVLRHIWQMCDVTRDGALNLAEFTAAMHLVVLRRNNIPVPATLPPCLLPSLLQHSLLQPSGGSAGASGTAGVPASGASGELPSVAGGSGGGGSGSSINSSVSNERTEPAEADLLHLESDDNVESNNRKRFDAHKDYQRMVPVPDSLAFAKVASAGGNVNASGAAHDTSPPSVSSATGVPSSCGTTGSASVANATKGSSSGSNSSSTAVSTTGGRKTPPNVSPPVLTQQHVTASAQKVKQSSEHPVTPPNTKTTNKEWNSTTKEWTKFMESPTSNVSSPGPKPVNFDLQRTTQAIVSNPHIVHPVPLRVTPVGAEAVDNGSLVYGSDLPVGTGGLMVVQSRDDSSPKQHNSQAQSHHHSTPRDSLTNSGDLRAIQRPQPKKPPSKGVGAIPPPPQRDSGAHPSSNAHPGNNDSMTTSLDASGFAASSMGTTTTTTATTIERLPSLAKKQSVDQQQPPPPPLPPPRPSAHRHTRSSSLDLNKLKLTTNNASVAPIGDPLKMPPPPEVPPRVTPTGEAPSSQRQTHGFADFAHFPSGASSATVGHRIGSMGDPSNVTTIHLDAAGNVTHHSTPRGSGTLPKSLVMHQPRNSAFEVYRKPHTEGRLAARGSQSPPQQPPLVTSRSVESSGVVSGDYDKRISALSDSLRQVRFKANDPPPVMPDVLKQLKEQNLLLLRICNDLSEELLHIQQKREDIRIKIELQEQILGGGSSGSGMLSTGPSSLPAVSSSSSHHHSHHHVNL